MTDDDMHGEVLKFEKVVKETGCLHAYNNVQSCMYINNDERKCQDPLQAFVNCLKSNDKYFMFLHENMKTPKAEKVLKKIGCLHAHNNVEKCMSGNKDWHKCQDSVQAFENCLKSKNIPFLRKE